MKLTESEKKIDNMLRSVNKHLKDVFNTFGARSTEYQTAQLQAYEQLKGMTQIKIPDTKNNVQLAPLQILRGRNAIAEIQNRHLEKSLSELREMEKITGTAKVQMQKYIEKLKSENVEVTPQNIRDVAESMTKYQFDDVYKAVTESENIPTEFIHEFIRKCKQLSVNDYGYMVSVTEYGRNLLLKYDVIINSNLGDYNDTDENGQSAKMSDLFKA